MRPDRLAEICGQYLGKFQLESLEGRLQTRQWEDDRNLRHSRTEIVASDLEMLSGRRKKDYAAEALENQADVMGLGRPVDAEDFPDADETSDIEAEAAVPVAA